MRKNSYILNIKKAKREGYDKGVDDTVKNYSAVVMLCLKDKFGFSPEQLQQASKYINNMFESVCDDYLSLNDIITTLKEEDNIDILYNGVAIESQTEFAPERWDI